MRGRDEMSQVVIAIPQMGNDLFRKYMKSKYEKSLNRSGAVVKWIELENVENAVKEALKCDGLLLPGGADVNPKMYGESPIEACGKPNDLRDNAEVPMFKEFLKTGKPILSICRGFQLVNVICGGNLYQDIKNDQKCKHMDFFSRGKYIHTVKIEKNTKLYEIFNSAEIKVNSMHHQAVKNVGENLIPTAVSSDGYVEAFELKDHKFCVAVQWHPEHMAKKNKSQQKLFDVFVNNCK